MKTKMGLYRNIFIAIFMILFVGCASKTDPGILTGSETCKPPCWMDIQPGITKSEDMIRMLQEHEKREDGSLTLLDSGIARWQSANDKNIYVYKADNGLVSKIELDLRPSSIHLDDIIVLFEEPSNVDIGKISDGYFFATIFYPEKGLAFVVGGNKFDVDPTTMSFSIQSDMVVVKGVYFQPRDLTSMVNLLYGINAVSEALSDIQEWNGYGVYNE